MADMAEERFEQAMEDIDRSLSDTQEIAAEFSKEMTKLQSSVQETSRSLSTLERGVSRGMRRAIDGVVFDGANLSETLRSLGTSMLNSGYRAAINPVADHLGGALAGGLNSLLQGMTPFARGGVVSQATGFAMSGGGLVAQPADEIIRHRRHARVIPPLKRPEHRRSWHMHAGID